MKILIDNGHGLDTPGKRSPDGKLREYAWNRQIAGRIVAALTDLGHDAQLLVPEQEDISLSERYRRVNTICQALGAQERPALSFGTLDMDYIGGFCGEIGVDVTFDSFLF